MSDSHKIRIATYGHARGGRAASVEEVTCGIRVPWVEIDGHRFDAITHAVIDFGKDDLASCEVTLGVIGPVEVVYVDAEGDPLPGAPSPLVDPATGYGSTMAGVPIDYKGVFGPPDDPAREHVPPYGQEPADPEVAAEG